MMLIISISLSMAQMQHAAGRSGVLGNSPQHCGSLPISTLLQTFFWLSSDKLKNCYFKNYAGEGDLFFSFLSLDQR